MSAIYVEHPGLLTTIQDEGRWGWQAFGVPVSGPMDWWSHRAANLLVGNPAAAATLEVTVSGPVLTARARVTVGVAGAGFELLAGARPTSSPAVLSLEAGETLRFGARIAGCRAYVAFAGGIEVPPVLGSRATDVRSGLGGIDGRPIRAGDVLPIGSPPVVSLPPHTPVVPALPQSSPVTLRFMPHDDFTAEVIDRVRDTVFRVSPQSDRVGYRLDGALEIGSGDLRRLSRPAVMGLIQLPPAGGPVLLMADAQPTGGYPILGAVITGDLPVAGQLAPGDAVRFVPCSREEATAALAARERTLPIAAGTLRVDR